MFESPLNKDSAASPTVIATWRIIWTARWCCPFLVGFLFSWFSTVCLLLTGHTRHVAVPVIVTFFLNLNWVLFTLCLVRYFYILTMADYVLNESSCSLKTRTTLSLTTSCIWSQTRRSIAAASTILKLTWAVTTHSNLILSGHTEAGHSIVPVSCLFNNTMKSRVSKQLHIKIINC